MVRSAAGVEPAIDRNSPVKPAGAAALKGSLPTGNMTAQFRQAARSFLAYQISLCYASLQDIRSEQMQVQRPSPSLRRSRQPGMDRLPLRQT